MGSVGGLGWAEGEEHCRSCKGLCFSPQHPHGGVQASVFRVPGGLPSSPGLRGINHAHGAQIYIQAKCSYDKK